jgi:hypothetical protein
MRLAPPQVLAACKSTGQSGPLAQRLSILSTFLLQSEENAEFRDMKTGLETAVAPGALIVADLTDPLLSPQDAASVFQVGASSSPRALYLHK